MAEIGWASLGVTPTFNNFGRSLDRGATPLLNRFGDNAGRSMGRRAGSTFGRVFTGTLGALGVFSAGSAALRFLGDSVSEGREAVRVGNQTKAVIKSTGGVAKVTNRDVTKLANSLSRVGGVDDEIVQGGANILLTFKNIRNEAGENNKIFDKANKAALNLSTSLGKDLNSSALMVGKALNDPVAGMTALGRAGVQFSLDQKDAIKRMVETGDTLGAQKIILRELNEQFRGSAKAQRTEADRLAVSWGNFKEQIGTALIPVLDKLAKFLRKEGIPRAKQFFKVLQEDGVPAAKQIYKYGKVAAESVKDIVGAFNGMPGWVKKILVAGAAGAFTAKKLGLTKLVGGEAGLFSKGGTPLNPLWVRIVGGGGGAGGVGAGKGFLAGLVATLGASTILSVNQLHRGGENKPANGLGFLGPGGINNWLHSHGIFDGESDQQRRIAEDNRIKRQQEFVARLGQEWLSTKDKANDYNLFVRNKLPGELKFTVLGWPLAQKQARDYLATLLQIRAVHIDTRLDRAGGSGGAGEGVVPLPPTPHQEPPTRGVNINIERLEATDPKAMLRGLQTSAHRASSDGVRMPTGDFR